MKQIIKGKPPGTSVADPHEGHADPNPACHYDADPDPYPVCHFDADLDPDPTFQFDVDPDPSCQIKTQNLKKVLK